MIPQTRPARVFKWRASLPLCSVPENFLSHERISANVFCYRYQTWTSLFYTGLGLRGFSLYIPQKRNKVPRQVRASQKKVSGSELLMAVLLGA